MAKWTATCTCKHCGKEFERTGYEQNRRLADSKAEWVAEHSDECPECYKARRKAERENEAREAIGNFQLPELEGTEKQIAYATDLRDGFLAENRQMVEKLREVFAQVMQADYNQLNEIGKDLKLVLTETSAHRVIDGLMKGYY